MKYKVYHGSDSKFDKFDKSFIGTGNGGGLFGIGFYFATDENLAREYGNNVQCYIVELKNPYIFYSKDCFQKLIDTLDKKGIKYLDIIHSFDEYESDPMELLDNAIIDSSWSSYSNDFTDLVKDAGFDGIFAGDEVVAFEPEQISKYIKEDIGSDEVQEFDVEKPELSTNTSWQKIYNVKDKDLISAFISIINSVGTNIDVDMNNNASSCCVSIRTGSEVLRTVEVDVGIFGRNLSEVVDFKYFMDDINEEMWKDSFGEFPRAENKELFELLYKNEMTFKGLNLGTRRKDARKMRDRGEPIRDMGVTFTGTTWDDYLEFKKINSEN